MLGCVLLCQPRGSIEHALSDIELKSNAVSISWRRPLSGGNEKAVYLRVFVLAVVQQDVCVFSCMCWGNLQNISVFYLRFQ